MNIRLKPERFIPKEGDLRSGKMEAKKSQETSNAVMSNCMRAVEQNPFALLVLAGSSASLPIQLIYRFQSDNNRISRIDAKSLRQRSQFFDSN